MMKRQVLIGATFLVGCVAGGVSSQLVAPPARAGAPITRWEHFCVETDNDAEDATPELNRAGAQGWELGAATAVGAGLGQTLVLCLKRPM